MNEFSTKSSTENCLSSLSRPISTFVNQSNNFQSNRYTNNIGKHIMYKFK